MPRELSVSQYLPRQAWGLEGGSAVLADPLLSLGKKPPTATLEAVKDQDDEYGPMCPL